MQSTCIQTLVQSANTHSIQITAHRLCNQHRNIQLCNNFNAHAIRGEHPTQIHWIYHQYAGNHLCNQHPNTQVSRQSVVQSMQMHVLFNKQLCTQCGHNQSSIAIIIIDYGIKANSVCCAINAKLSVKPAAHTQAWSIITNKHINAINTCAIYPTILSCASNAHAIS